jgi:methionyl-tRNA formyltransferase
MVPVDVVGLAHTLRIPVLEVGRLRDEAALAALASLAPEVLCAACFPRLLPPEWLHTPRLGCLNLHPSLLPAYRGPEPLFWQFRNGEGHTGVTVHFMDEGADTGDIVAQAEAPFPNGITYVDAERLAAQAGAQLLVDALAQAPIPRRPQSTTGVSSAPHPSAEALTVHSDWPAQRAFNFVRGAEAWGPFHLQIGEARFRLRSAVSISANETLGEPFQRQTDRLVVQFADGVVRFIAAE